MFRQTKIVVDVNNYIKNSKAFINHTGKKMMGIIKADAYGLVDYVMGKYLEESGIDFFGVSSLEEALRLREHGIKSDILVLSYVHNLALCKENDISVIIPNRMFIDNNKDQLKELRVHIKINTGLNRLGILPCDLKDVIDDLNKYGAKIEGVMTHYACTENKEYTNKQFSLFKDAVKSSNFNFKYVHTCATDAAIYLKDDISNYVRIGLGLLGIANIDDPFSFNNVVTLLAEVIECKKVNKGDGISYHHNHISDGEGYYLTCSIGYADGLDLKYKNKPVYINGEKAFIAGNVCMDLIVVKASKPYPIGSEIEIIGENVPIKQRVKELESNACKVITDLSDRITRQYYKDGKLDKEINPRFDR